MAGPTLTCCAFGSCIIESESEPEPVFRIHSTIKGARGMASSLRYREECRWTPVVEWLAVWLERCHRRLPTGRQGEQAVRWRRGRHAWARTSWWWKMRRRCSTLCRRLSSVRGTGCRPAAQVCCRWQAVSQSWCCSMSWSIQQWDARLLSNGG